MKQYFGWTAVLVGALLTQGCNGFFASAGASRSQVEAVATPENNSSYIELVAVDNQVANRVMASQRSMRFKDSINPKGAPDNLVGPGDTLEVMLWEAPPAILFRNTTQSSFLGSMTPTGTTMTTLPPQMVNKQGDITIPFVGKVHVAGKTPVQIEGVITQELRGKANQPQVIVRVAGNAASTVTVVGEVAQSARLPLSPKGERVLDAIAAVGGVKQPVNKTTIQIARNGQIQSLPMETIIQDPKQNIPLHPGDVITAYFQPLSFTVLGATGKNEEIMFEAQGITLAQALGRSSGLRDLQADSKGLYIFRYEEPRALDLSGKSQIGVTAEGKVPVIYSFNMNDPATFFAAQNFPMQNKDVMYAATASSVELMKFLGIITSLFAPAVIVMNAPIIQ